jgi:uroporphyrinogen decarboxylase
VTGRERILAALGRRAADRLPLDLGSTIASTMTRQAHERLREYLGVPADVPAATFSRRASTVIPDEAILERFGIDCRPLLLGDCDARPDRPLPGGGFLDEWGVTWEQPADGHFIPRSGPFSGIAEPSAALLDKHDWPDPADPGRCRGLRERARALHEGAPYAVVLNLGVGPVHICQFLRGYAEWLMDLLASPAFAEGLLEAATNFWVALAVRALEKAAPFVDAVCFGDDIGTQRGPLLRPALYRRVVKPRHRRMVDAVKRYGKPVVYHTCGGVVPLLPDLIDAGIDALNPVQVSAAGMDAAALKREFGGHLAFWGGVDTQRVLPRGTPAEVREEVRRRTAELGGGGGYVLCAVHNIQPEVPPANVAAMYEAALQFGR